MATLSPSQVLKAGVVVSPAASASSTWELAGLRARVKGHADIDLTRGVVLATGQGLGTNNGCPQGQPIRILPQRWTQGTRHKVFWLWCFVFCLFSSFTGGGQGEGGLFGGALRQHGGVTTPVSPKLRPLS